MLETVFSKVAGFKACNFITKKVQHRCFPVKFAKSLRIPILKNICERLLLYLHYNSHHHFNFHHVHYHQKQPLAGVLQNRCSGKFCLCHRCFSAKFLRTPFLTKHLRQWLVLCHCKLHLYRPRIFLTIPLYSNFIPCLFQLNFVFLLPAYIFL